MVTMQVRETRITRNGNKPAATLVITRRVYSTCLMTNTVQGHYVRNFQLVG